MCSEGMGPLLQGYAQRGWAHHYNHILGYAQKVWAHHYNHILECAQKEWAHYYKDTLREDGPIITIIY